MDKWDKILKFNNKYFPKWREVALIYYSNALAGETGEICNLVKKSVGGGTNRRMVNNEEIAVEGIDVFIYLVLLLEVLGISKKQFDELFDSKMEVNKERMEKGRKVC